MEAEGVAKSYKDTLGPQLETTGWCAGSIPGKTELRYQSVIIHTAISLSVDTKDL